MGVELHPGQRVVGALSLAEVKAARVVVACAQELGLGQLLRAVPWDSYLGWFSLLCPTLSPVEVRVTGPSCPKEGRGSPGQREWGCGLDGTKSQHFSPVY